MSSPDPAPVPGRASLPAPEDLPDLLKIPEVAHAPWVRLLLAAGGTLCMILGVVGWLVPVVTGIPFYLAGLLLLSMSHPPFGVWLNRKERTLSPRVRLLLRPKLRKQWKAAASDVEAE